MGGFSGGGFIQILPELQTNYGLIFTTDFTATFYLFNNAGNLPPATANFITNNSSIAAMSMTDEEQLKLANLYNYQINNPSDSLIFSMPVNVFNINPPPTVAVTTPEGSFNAVGTLTIFSDDVFDNYYVFDNPLDSTTLVAVFGIAAVCLHGSSIVQMKEGTKRIDQIRKGDEVLSGDHKYAKVIKLAHCWLSFMSVDHDAIIFEPNSLGPNCPSERLIIDPGHPICTQKEYDEKGYEALRPAGTYWEESTGDKIITKKWTDIFVQNDKSLRYDLILEEPHNTYIANGMVVRSKGYKEHRYKDFV